MIYQFLVHKNINITIILFIAFVKKKDQEFWIQKPIDFKKLNYLQDQLIIKIKLITKTTENIVFLK